MEGVLLNFNSNNLKLFIAISGVHSFLNCSTNSRESFNKDKHWELLIAIEECLIDIIISKGFRNSLLSLRLGWRSDYTVIRS